MQCYIQLPPDFANLNFLCDRTSVWPTGLPSPTERWLGIYINASLKLCGWKVVIVQKRNTLFPSFNWSCMLNWWALTIHLFIYILLELLLHPAYWVMFRRKRNWTSQVVPTHHIQKSSQGRKQQLRCEYDRRNTGVMFGEKSLWLVLNTINAVKTKSLGMCQNQFASAVYENELPANYAEESFQQLCARRLINYSMAVNWRNVGWL